MNTVDDFLLPWLRDAYAMEMQATELLERQAGRLTDYPELATKVRAHLEETKWQAQQLQSCLERLGSDPSMLKNAVGKLSANMSALGTMLSSDEVVKSSIASAMFERYEIANYRVLIAAAEFAGQPEIAQTCRSILAQEEAMAEWLDAHLPETTAKFLGLQDVELRKAV